MGQAVSAFDGRRASTRHTKDWLTSQVVSIRREAWSRPKPQFDGGELVIFQRGEGLVMGTVIANTDSWRCTNNTLPNIYAEGFMEHQVKPLRQKGFVMQFSVKETEMHRFSELPNAVASWVEARLFDSQSE